VIDVVPWDTAQIASGAQSAAVAGILRRRLGELGVPQLSGTVTELPLRTLVAANMPAIMIEVGFLSNAADTKALGEQGDRLSKIVDAILLMLGDIRSGIPAAPPAPPAPSAVSTTPRTPPARR
jgi:N-acetylmuramoyl-L-alanine amidase